MCKISSVAAMAPIATYVFLDLGTTSKYADSNEITELSMVAVDRQQFLDSISQENPEIPKFLNKLTRCFKPETQKISYTARADGTGGFTEEMLQGELSLNESCFHLIDTFLYSLAKPVCIIAHYGFQSDYIILKRYFTKLQVKFSSELVCVDTHQAFYDILEEKRDEKYVEEYLEQLGLIPANSSKPINRERDIIRDAAFEERPGIRKILETMRNDNPSLSSCNPLPGQDALNPGNSSMPSITPLPGQDALNAFITELKEGLRRFLKNHRRKYERKDKKRAKRQYPWGPEINMPGVSYELPETYTRVFKRKPRDAHKAEVDCILMLEIAVKLGQDFVDWVDDETNQLLFPSLTEEI
ncbi:uncharacterized protein LOC134670537 [Cydia fagiglandana]|uniref:uncharacterized protein LOC134670537 n=1 Tax=Cydia fagiglandana TaxID=1458189 RepID=UPI002FEE57DD